jgi:four helix bundle protein
LSKQLLKSGTSIGANLAEAECAISKNDFLAKLYISLKETSETLYWLDLLHETSFLPDNEYQSICQDATGIHKLLSSITKTLREKHEHE